MIDARRAQLFAPREPDWKRQLLTPLAIPGRNSCRKVGEFFKLASFNYPVPACGARNRPMNVAVINA